MAFNALEALTAFGLGAQQSQQKRMLERQERDLDRKEQTRTRISEYAGAGDYQGASTAAIQGGEYDLAGTLSGLDERAKAQALQEAQIMGRAAAQLKAVSPEQRGQAYQQLAPLLKQAGFSDEELAQADLSDEGLDGYVQFGQSVSSVLSPPKQLDPTSWQREAMAAGIMPGSPEYRAAFERRNQANPQIIMVDGKPHMMGGSAPQAPAPENMGPDQLRAQAQEAIANGADPAAVNARLQQMLGGAGQQGPQTFR